MQGDEWEEKWGEHYWSKGRAHKWADKWGKDGPNVWHERWGEDYPGDDACFKYTDKARPQLSTTPGHEAPILLLLGAPMTCAIECWSLTPMTCAYETLGNRSGQHQTLVVDACNALT